MSRRSEDRFARSAAMFACLLLIGITQGEVLNAQQAVSIANAPSGSVQTGANGKPLEIEIVEIGRAMTWPNVISRPTGKFILLLRFRPDASISSLQIDPSDVPIGTLGPNPILRVDTQIAHSTERSLAFVVDLPKGEFHMKNGASGAMLNAITGK
jgi:hypothetical protein